MMPVGYDRPMMKHTTKLAAAAALALAALASACQSHTDHDLSTTSTTADLTEGEAVTSAPPAEAVPMRHAGESRIYGDCPSEDSCTLDFEVDALGRGAWYVDGERVEGVSCPTEDSCTPMYHPDEDGFMIHEVTP